MIWQGTMFACSGKSAIAKLWIFHILVIAVSNYLVQFPQSFGGVSFTWAMFTFPLVVLATDLTVRLLGRGAARTVVGFAYIPAIAISVYLTDWRIGFASGTAYLVG
jgi:queuosine precursor transporter